jgi:ATP synthase protein I
MTEQGPGQRPDQGPDAGRSGAEARAGAAPVQPAGLVTAATGGFEFAVAILLGVFAGQWLDRRMGTAPWLVILGVAVGAAAGFYNLYRTLTTVRPRVASRDSRPGKGTGGPTGKADGEHGGTG